MPGKALLSMADKTKNEKPLVVRSWLSVRALSSAHLVHFVVHVGLLDYYPLEICSDDDASLLSGRPVSYFLC